MKISLKLGDITKSKVDVIVNAANTSLLGGGGVDGAIHNAGGKAILDACIKIRNKQGGCKVGESVITDSGNLPCLKVIHTVGPKWNQGKSEEANKLSNCYLSSLKLADDIGFRTIAFPNISTGIYGYPKLEAAQIAIQSIKYFKESSLSEVIFICFDKDNFKIYEKLLIE